MAAFAGGLISSLIPWAMDRLLGGADPDPDPKKASLEQMTEAMSVRQAPTMLSADEVNTLVSPLAYQSQSIFITPQTAARENLPNRRIFNAIERTSAIRSFQWYDTANPLMLDGIECVFSFTVTNSYYSRPNLGAGQSYRDGGIGARYFDFGNYGIFDFFQSLRVELNGTAIYLSDVGTLRSVFWATQEFLPQNYMLTGSIRENLAQDAAQSGLVEKALFSAAANYNYLDVNDVFAVRVRLPLSLFRVPAVLYPNNLLKISWLVQSNSVDVMNFSNLQARNSLIRSTGSAPFDSTWRIQECERVVTLALTDMAMTGYCLYSDPDFLEKLIIPHTSLRMPFDFMWAAPRTVTHTISWLNNGQPAAFLGQTMVVQDIIFQSVPYSTYVLIVPTIRLRKNIFQPNLPGKAIYKTVVLRGLVTWDMIIQNTAKRYNYAESQPFPFMSQYGTNPRTHVDNYFMQLDYRGQQAGHDWSANRMTQAQWMTAFDSTLQLNGTPNAITEAYEFGDDNQTVTLDLRAAYWDKIKSAPAQWICCRSNNDLNQTQINASGQLEVYLRIPIWFQSTYSQAIDFNGCNPAMDINGWFNEDQQITLTYVTFEQTTTTYGSTNVTSNVLLQEFFKPTTYTG